MKKNNNPEPKPYPLHVRSSMISMVVLKCLKLRMREFFLSDSCVLLACAYKVREDSQFAAVLLMSFTKWFTPTKEERIESD